MHATLQPELVGRVHFARSTHDTDTSAVATGAMANQVSTGADLTVPGQDWLRCFDAPASRVRYAETVYGPGAGAWFHWTHGLELVYHERLVAWNHSCWYHDAAGVYRRFPPIKAMSSEPLSWVDFRPRSLLMPKRRLDNRGGDRVPARAADWSWVEVIHQPGLGGAMALDHLWMYMAKGSGLWFHAGRVLECSDFIDLAMYLGLGGQNLSLSYPARRHVINEAVTRLSSQFDTISFGMHIDRYCCTAAVMHELVSLKSFSLGCPVSEDLRRGWPPDRLQHCRCNTSSVGERHRERLC